MPFFLTRETPFGFQNMDELRVFFEGGNGTPLQYSCMENAMDGEPGRLQSMGSLRVRHD